jgi:hypothetical protein
MAFAQLCPHPSAAFKHQVTKHTLHFRLARWTQLFCAMVHRAHRRAVRALEWREKADKEGLVLQGPGSEPGQYNLVTQFPRRVIQMTQYPSEATLADAGLTGRQEALLLEPLTVH